MAVKTGRTRCEIGVLQLTGLLNSFLCATRLMHSKVNPGAITTRSRLQAKYFLAQSRDDWRLIK